MLERGSVFYYAFAVFYYAFVVSLGEGYGRTSRVRGIVTSGRGDVRRGVWATAW